MADFPGKSPHGAENRKMEPYWFLWWNNNTGWPLFFGNHFDRFWAGGNGKWQVSKILGRNGNTHDICSEVPIWKTQAIFGLIFAKMSMSNFKISSLYPGVLKYFHSIHNGEIYFKK